MSGLPIPFRLIAMTCLGLIGLHTVGAQEALAEDAEQLVQRALQAELRGRSNERDELLRSAIDADPSYAPARWQSGQVSTDDEGGDEQWRSVADVERLSAADTLLAEYRSIRRTNADDAAGNEAIAKWCQRRGLAERAKIHWARVLSFQPNHPTAIRRLGLREYHGRWFTREQIAEIREHKVRAARVRQEWLPTFYTWRKVFRGRDTNAQDEARLEMRQAASVELVGLFETQLSTQSEELALAVVDALADVTDQVATESLVRHATLSEWSSVRSAATEQLKGRSPHGYVPILIDAMMSPFEFQTWTVRSPVEDDHVLALNYSVERKGKHVDRVLEGTVNIQNDFDGDRAEEISEELAERVEELNEETERFNEPLWEALKTTTGLSLGNDPTEWNDWWNEYNEYLIPDFRPVFSSFQRSTSIVAFQPFACFPAGVTVATQTGDMPIEDIRVGDYVLSQHPVTGELKYQPVLQTTVRDSDAILEVALENESLLVTRGHPMWVNGRAWQMAKQLRRGDILHGVDGPVQVRAIRSASHETAVYNLVVAEFHTYFVADSRVLVHDNSIYTPPGVSIPGE